MLAPDRFRRLRRNLESGERRTMKERGAALLEFALIAPFFFFVVFGGIEIGFMFRSYLAVQDTARVAARVASVERNNVDADLAILESIQRRAGALNADISRVVIFSAETLDSPIPDHCKTDFDSSDGECNLYLVDLAAGDSLQTVIDGFLPEDGLKAADREAWDNVGVYIQYEYDFVTGFFDSMTLESEAIEVIELDL